MQPITMTPNVENRQIDCLQLMGLFWAAHRYITTFLVDGGTHSLVEHWRVYLAALLTAAAALTSIASSARAEFIGEDLALVSVRDARRQLNAEFSIANPFLGLSADEVPARAEVMIDEPFELFDGATLLGTVHSLGVTLDREGAVDLDFKVTAGDIDVQVDIASARVSFPPLIEPPAFVSAEFTLIDNVGDGSALGSNDINPDIYRAMYNNSLRHESLIPIFSVNDGSETRSEFHAGPIVSTVGGDPQIRDLRSLFRFGLPAGDTAIGSGQFMIVPEPSSIVSTMAACFGLAIWTSRRKRTSLFDRN